jgi:hypothetical protein
VRRAAHCASAQDVDMLYVVRCGVCTVFGVQCVRALSLERAPDWCGYAADAGSAGCRECYSVRCVSYLSAGFDVLRATSGERRRREAQPATFCESRSTWVDWPVRILPPLGPEWASP